MNTVAGTIFTSIKSAAQKDNSSTDDMSPVNKDLNVTEWKTFNESSNQKILDNYQRIGEFKVKMNEPHNTFDVIYSTRLEKLEAQNVELKSILDNYNGDETQWEVFKKHFNRDLNQVGNDIKELFR
jgi:hypothetical protein